VLKKTATIAATPPQGSAVAATTVTAAAPYTLNFNVTLIAEGPSAYSSSAEDLSGTWVDEASGGRVLMETDGRIVHMTEVRWKPSKVIPPKKKKKIFDVLRCRLSVLSRHKYTQLKNLLCI
jgi:hypothetical protein